jgi:hypothetical protein
MWYPGPWYGIWAGFSGSPAIGTLSSRSLISPEPRASSQTEKSPFVYSDIAEILDRGPLNLAEPLRKPSFICIVMICHIC